MAEREYKILVSYALARNSGAVFQDAEASSARARKKIEGDGKAAGDAMGRSGKKGADLLGKSFDDAAAKGQKAYAQIVAAAEKAAAQEAALAQRAAQARVAADQRAFDQRLRLAQRASAERIRLAAKEEADILRDVERAAKQEQAARDRAAKSSARKSDRNYNSFASDTMSGIRGTASKALGVAGSIATGMGVNLDLGSQIASSGEYKRNIVDVTNAGMGIQGKLAGQQDYTATTKAVEDAADHTKIAQNTIAQGLSVFVDKASDIEAGKAMLKGLGDIAQASGTDFVELAGSAGEFFKMMDGDGPSKIKNVEGLLKLAAKQGQVGNLAFKELAPTIGKLASQGQKITGNYSENLGQLMALSQISLQGGAAKGAEATRAGQAFVMDMSKSSTMKAFHKYGVKTFEDQNEQGGGTVLRQMEPVIIELLKKSKGDIKTLTEEFKGMKSGAVITGAANIFRAAGGTEKGGLDKGLAAVQEAFDKYKQPMSDKEIENSAGAVRDTAGAKAAAFNNQLERIAGSLAERVLPEMEKLGPMVLQVVEAFAHLVGWVATNPMEAVVGAIVLSITKAAIGTAISNSLSGMLSKMGGMNIAAATIGIAVGTLIVSKINKDQREGAAEVLDRDRIANDTQKRAKEEYDKTGTLSPETRKDLEDERKRVMEEFNKGFGTKTAFQAYNPLSDTTFKQLGEQETAKGMMGSLAADQKGIDALLALPDRIVAAVTSIKDGVKITNMPAAGLTPPGDGRPGVGGHGGGP